MDIPIGSVQGIISLFVAAGVGLGGKIIFDYLRLTRTPANKNGGAQAFKSFKLLCERQHQGINKSFEVIEEKIERIDACIVREKIKTQKNIDEIKGHEKRLEKGIKKFDDIATDISSIKENVAILLDRSDKRRKTDYSKGVPSES